MAQEMACPHCGRPVARHRNPVPTVDVVVFDAGLGIVLVKRANPPEGWALPGGFVDYGETVEAAAVREVREETGLDVALTGLLGVYSDPERDPRRHTLSVVFTGQTKDVGKLRAGDDAARAQFFPLALLPESLAFDHGRIVDDFRRRLRRPFVPVP